MMSQSSCILLEVACTWSCGRKRIINSTPTKTQHIMNYISRDFIQLTHMQVKKKSLPPQMFQLHSITIFKHQLFCTHTSCILSVCFLKGSWEGIALGVVQAGQDLGRFKVNMPSTLHKCLKNAQIIEQGAASCSFLGYP